MGDGRRIIVNISSLAPELNRPICDKRLAEEGAEGKGAGSLSKNSNFGARKRNCIRIRDGRPNYTKFVLDYRYVDTPGN